VAAALGYRCAIVIPRTQSQEKKDAIRLMGAELIEVDAVPYADPGNYVRYSGRLAQERAATEPNGVIWANQFDNTANRRAHFESTGPEIWAQTEGRIDAFVAASGTGGTLAGTAEYLKSRSAAVRTVLADPPGSSLFEWVRHGELKATGKSSVTEGIGIARVTANFKDAQVDAALHVEDTETIAMVYRLLHEEGLFLGSTSGINVTAAVRLARELGPGHTIVTILCDSGSKYMSRLYDRTWLAEKGLLEAADAGVARGQSRR